MPENQILDLGLAMVAGVVGAYVTVRVQVARLEERVNSIINEISTRVEYSKDRSDALAGRVDRLEAK